MPTLTEARINFTQGRKIIIGPQGSIVDIIPATQSGFEPIQSHYLEQDTSQEATYWITFLFGNMDRIFLGGITLLADRVSDISPRLHAALIHFETLDPVTKGVPEVVLDTVRSLIQAARA